MKVTDPRYEIDQGYPSLVVTIDGNRIGIPAETKPTLLRWGLVYLGGKLAPSPVQFQGKEVRGLSADPALFKLYVTFGLECYYGRIKAGVAKLEPDPKEVAELGERLVNHSAGAPDWAELTSF